jgi:SAM-dependent methyltransferase
MVMKQFANHLARRSFAAIGLKSHTVPPLVTPVGTNSAWMRAFSHIKTRVNLRRFSASTNRMLEIGPGPERIAGFETLNVISGHNVDYVWDATDKLPFKNDTFQVIYASHILEHVPWYQTLNVVREWVRILRPGGSLEIWVPDGLKICKAFVDAEHLGADIFEYDPWTRFNEERDPCKWAAGRIFTYGDGTGRSGDPNWHRALFSPRYLCQVLEHAGLTRVRLMNHSEVRGFDHGWINLGMKGVKAA